MNIENLDISMVEREWSKDSKIDLANLNGESSKTLEMHSKYFRILNAIKKIKRGFDIERQRLIFLRTDWYLGNIPKHELDRLGWKPNPKIILKAEIDRYLAADDMLIEVNQNIDECNDIIYMVEGIIKCLNNRQFIIKNILEEKRFTNGGW